MTATRFANKRRLAPFKPRAQAMLDDLGSLITDLEKSGRKVMLVVVRCRRSGKGRQGSGRALA